MSIFGLLGANGRGNIQSPPRFIQNSYQDSLNAGLNWQFGPLVPGIKMTVGLNWQAVVTETRIAPAVLAVTLNYQAQVTGTRIVAASLIATLNYQALANPKGTYGAVLAAGLAWTNSVSGKLFVASVQQPGVDKSLRTWVVNTETGASSQYDNYGFNAYAYDGTEYLASAEDGIYKLQGSNDAGVTINSLVQMPKRDYGTLHQKRIRNLWIGVASNQQLVLKVDVEGATYYYTANSSSTTMETQRFDLGRGLSSTYWTFTLTSPDAFQLESIAFEPVALTRRI